MSILNLKGTTIAAVLAVFVILFVSGASAQARRPAKSVVRTQPVKAIPPASPAVPADAPIVTQVDDAAFRKLLVPNGKPLMINFWATWCGPCREEFPDLVKLDGEYKGRIDFLTISLDEPEDLTTGVPKFLHEMKAKMPTFLLETPDEEAAIVAVSKDWAGALPLTVIYDPKGSIAYFRQGKIDPDTVRTELNKLLPPAEPGKTAP